MGFREKFLNTGTEKLGSHREKTIAMLHAYGQRLPEVIFLLFSTYLLVSSQNIKTSEFALFWAQILRAVAAYTVGPESPTFLKQWATALLMTVKWARAPSRNPKFWIRGASQQSPSGEKFWENHGSNKIWMKNMHFKAEFNPKTATLDWLACLVPFLVLNIIPKCKVT